MAEKQIKLKNRGKQNENLFLASMIGFMSGLASILVLTLLFSSLSLKFRNPINIYMIFSVLSVVIGSFISGITSSSIYKKEPLWASLISSLIISFILILSNLNSENNNSIINIQFMPLISILFGFVGCLLSKSKTKKKNYKKYFN